MAKKQGNEMTIQELNERRAAAAFRLQCIGTANMPTKIEDRLKGDAAYRLAQDASQRAEKEYADALNALSTDELVALANGG
jgi:hypothetical protein